MRRTLLSLAIATALLATGCGGTGPLDRTEGPAGTEAPPSTSSSDAHGHGSGHGAATDPGLPPPGMSGTPALGRLLQSTAELSDWVRDTTGECAEVSPADMDDLADYLGPTRVEWYRPFVAEWATCRIAPYDKLGLVVFKPGQQQALQEFWLRGLRSGEIGDNPDWAFGNGFAITAGPLGTERLGLHYLWCEPVEGTDAHIIPGDVEGCVYAK